MVIFNTEYKSYYEWKPWSNTILYCPLKDDINDHSWNHTMALNTTSFWTVEKDSTGFYHFTWWYISSESYTWPSKWTISVWVKRENKSTWITTLQWWFGIQQTWSSPFYNMAFEFNKSYYITTWTGTAHFIDIWASTLNTWELWTATFSSATWWKMYKNWVLVDSFSDSNNLWSATGYSFIGGNAFNDLWVWSQYFKWYLSDAIIEDKARTAQEIADYYNWTKWNYGL